MYDSDFTGRWEWAVDSLLATASQKLSYVEGKPVSLAQTMDYVQAKLAKSICTTAEKYCIAGLRQYQNLTQCYNFLTNKTRLGKAYELGTCFKGSFPVEYILTRVTGRDTVLCRMVHQNMVPLRPAVHCPHIGPTGGGFCDDLLSYSDTVEANYFTNSPFVYGNGSLTG